MDRDAYIMLHAHNANAHDMTNGVELTLCRNRLFLVTSRRSRHKTVWPAKAMKCMCYLILKESAA